MKKQNYFQFTFPILAFTGLIYSYFFKSEPPIFPRPLNEEIPDCLNIFVHNISTKNNKINISIYANKFHEYPQLAAPYLLRINTKVGNFESHFSYPALYDIVTENGTSSFNIIQKAPGNVSISVSCQNIILNETSFTIDSISLYSTGYTHLFKKDNLSRSMNNICINKSKITIFSESGNNSTSFISSRNVNGTIESKTGKITNLITSDIFILNAAFIIQANPKTINDLMIDALLPTFVLQQTKGILPIYLMKENELLKSGLKIISGHQPIISDEYRCLGETMLVLARGNRDILSLHEQTDDDQIKMIFNESTDFMKLKKFFNCNEPDKSTVVVVAGDIDKYQKMCSKYNFKSIKGMNKIEEVAKIVSSSKIFIAEEKDSYIQAVWLSKGSTLIANLNNSTESLLEEKLKINISKKFTNELCV